MTAMMMWQRVGDAAAAVAAAAAHRVMTMAMMLVVVIMMIRIVDGCRFCAFIYHRLLRDSLNNLSTKT